MTYGVNIANIRMYAKVDDTDTTQNEALKVYWTNCKHHFDTQAGIHTTTPEQYYSDTVIDLFEQGAAAWWIYWNSPNHPMDGVRMIYKMLDDYLKAVFMKATEQTATSQITKTSSAVTGIIP